MQRACRAVAIALVDHDGELEAGRRGGSSERRVGHAAAQLATIDHQLEIAIGAEREGMEPSPNALTGCSTAGVLGGGGCWHATEHTANTTNTVNPATSVRMRRII